jgi:hypothetical protein
MAENRQLRPGWQGSETSGVQATVYSYGDDPVFPGPQGGITLRGRSNRDVEPSIVAATWVKTMGQPAGQFQLQVKAPNEAEFRKQVIDDDWLDLVFTRGDRQFHVCRGMVDTVRRGTQVSNGATDTTFTIRGRDFGKIWTQTQIYFNRFIADDVGGTALIQANAGNGEQLFGDVPETVFAFLQQFIIDRQQNENNGVFWTLPPGIPGIGRRALFTEVVNFFRDNGGHTGGIGYTDRPSRLAFRPSFIQAQGTDIWTLAQQWSDPVFCELYTELVDKNKFAIPGPDEDLTPEDAGMAVILRDRPFPYGNDLRNDSAWFNLPEVAIPRQALDTGTDLGRGGEERYNAFFVKAKAYAEQSSAGVDLVAPLIDIEDVKRHGFRRFDATTNYHPNFFNDENWRTFIELQRGQLRDWHALNPYFLNGVIPLRRGFPEIRIGTKLRILGETGPEEDTVFYVEGVQHSWSLMRGMSTQVTVSRGWEGTDDSLLSAIVDARRRFSLIEGAPEALNVREGTGEF